MKKKLILFLIATNTAFAFPCHLTLLKDSCWADYEVSVDIIDASKDQKIANIQIPKGESWVRQQFECEPKQSLLFISQFSPAFWEKDEGKKYNAKRYWSLPETIAPKVTAWNMNICFPRDFSAVPLPPDAGSHCECSTKDVPPVKP